LLQNDPTHMAAISQLREIAFREGDQAWLEQLLEHESSISSTSLNGLHNVMQYHLGGMEYQNVLEIAEKIFQISPHYFEAHRLSAVAYNKLNQPAQALEAIQAALATRPSEPWCLEYQEFLQPEEENYSSPYLLNWQDIEIPDTLDISNANYVKLLDQKITKVHQNGNSSETVREAVKVLTDTGVRMLQARGLYYAGGEEIRVKTARVWKPDGTFYDAPAPQRRSTLSASDAARRLYGDNYVAILRFCDRNRIREDQPK